MKILVLADEEYKMYWDFFKKEDFKDIDIIVSCGDLKASYLSFLATMTSLPVLYVHGNHDTAYLNDHGAGEPGGCICIEDTVYVCNGLRFVGLGGCMRYKNGPFQYTEKEMRARARKLRFKLWRHKGFDVLVTHAPAKGVNDAQDLCHRGYQTFVDLIEKYQPKFFFHGHVHLSYGYNIPREDRINNTRVINGYERYIIEI